MTRPLVILAAALAASVALGARQEPAWTERPDWARFFTDAAVPGTIVVVDERVGQSWVCNEARAKERQLPASTFKVPHALFALDAGIVKDEFQVFKWDGVPRDITGWNRDQTIRTSMQYSTVWLYQEWARRLGEAREREYLQTIGYGNADPSGGVDRFWLDGGLRISAVEQVAFLQRLYRNALPFRVEHQRLVKDIMINEAGRDWILRAKTGWTARPERQVGWWVGWVERADGPVFFALNIDLPKKGEDAPKREAIARAILRSIDALPK